MVGLLIAMFAGLVVLMHLDGIVPRPGQTAVSQLAHHSFGSGPLYGYVQVTTALVLLLAANTAFNGFPRLLSFMARNGHAPRAVPAAWGPPSVQQRDARARARRGRHCSPCSAAAPVR